MKNYETLTQEIRGLVISNLHQEGNVYIGVNQIGEIDASQDEDDFETTLCWFNNDDYLDATACDDSGEGHTDECVCHPDDVMNTMQGERAIESISQQGADEYLRNN